MTNPAVRRERPNSVVLKGATHGNGASLLFPWVAACSRHHGTRGYSPWVRYNRRINSSNTWRLSLWTITTAGFLHLRRGGCRRWCQRHVSLLLAGNYARPINIRLTVQSRPEDKGHKCQAWLPATCLPRLEGDHLHNVLCIGGLCGFEPACYERTKGDFLKRRKKIGFLKN